MHVGIRTCRHIRIVCMLSAPAAKPVRPLCTCMRVWALGLGFIDFASVKILPTKHPSSHSRMSNIAFLTSLPRESLTWISCNRHSISHVEGHASRVRHEVVQLQKPKVSCRKPAKQARVSWSDARWPNIRLSLTSPTHLIALRT